MASPARQEIAMTDFPGLALAADPRDIPPGSSEEQVNMACINIGELVVRRGLREVTFED